MKTIIAGSRTIVDWAVLCAAVQKCGWKITSIISGGAEGPDKMGEKWAHSHNLTCKIFPAQWSKYGKSAGYKRNEEMLKEAQALIALWDEHSPGTAHMIKIARKKGIKVYVHPSANKFTPQHHEYAQGTQDL